MLTRRAAPLAKDGGADPKWRFMARVGLRPETTQYAELNAAPVVPAGQCSCAAWGTISPCCPPLALSAVLTLHAKPSRWSQLCWPGCCCQQSLRACSFWEVIWRSPTGFEEWTAAAVVEGLHPAVLQQFSMSQCSFRFGHAGFEQWTAVVEAWGTKMLDAVSAVAELAAEGFGLPASAFTDLMAFGPHLLAPTGGQNQISGSILLKQFLQNINCVLARALQGCTSDRTPNRQVATAHVQQWPTSTP